MHYFSQVCFQQFILYYKYKKLMKSIQDFVIMQKKLRQMQQVINNYKKQFKYLNESDITKKQTIQEMFQLISDLQEENKGLRNRINEFETQKGLLYKDFELLKVYNQQINLKFNEGNKKNKLLMEQIQNIKFSLQFQQKQNQLMKKKSEQLQKANQELIKKINQLAENNKNHELTVLQRSINQKASFFYQQQNSMLVCNQQEQIKYRINNLQKYIQKASKKNSTSTRYQTNRDCELKQNFRVKIKEFKRYFKQMRQNLGQIILKNKDSNDLSRSIKLLVIEIYDFLEKEQRC